MKKLLLTIAFLAIASTLFSQVTLNHNWTIRTSKLAGGLNGNSIAYNPVNNKLYVANRNDRKIVTIDLNPLDFSYYNINGTNNGYITHPSDWSQNTYIYNKIRVADDGAIYAINLAAAAVDSTIKVVGYRWSGYNDPNPKKFEIFMTGRWGDSFTVHGTGANTKLYIGGSDQRRILVCKVSATGDVTKDRIVYTPLINQSRGSISPVSSDVLWVTGSSSSIGPRKITISALLTDTAVIENSVVNADSISPLFSNAEFFVHGARRYLAISGAVVGFTGPIAQSNKSLDFELHDITNSETAPTKVASTRLYPLPEVPEVASNFNAYADVAIRKNIDGTVTFFHFAFGSGIASYTTSIPLPVLPVTLISFSGSLVNGQSTLAWSTASESNNKGFDILRSTDGQNFSSIGFVNSKGQNGNAATALDYSFVDRTAAAGVNYYQLNQIDNDGKSELSKEVVSVNVTLSGDAITVYPNPVTSYVNVSTGGLDHKGFKYEIFDGNGKKVVSQKAKSGEQQISVANLAPSVYFLKVSKDNVPQKTVKLIKE